jgi:D-3-phosphoglycerate dehydrogenase
MTAAPWNLMTLAPLSPAMAGAMLGDAPIAVVAPDRDDRDAVRAALADAELLIYDWRASATGLTAEEIAAAPHLAFVQQPSVGVPGHDIAALDAAGVPLANAAGFNAVAVAEWVLGALFGVARHLTWVERELREGRWPQVDVIARGPFEIGGRRVGIVGFGPIAHAVVAPLLAMGCTVSYWSRSRRAPDDERGARYQDLDELIATSDVLINLIALGDETRGLLSADRIAALPSGALVVSASRGGIVDEVAVLEAVERGHLAGAAFDVYETEPLPVDSPLRRCDRILLTSHTAGSTQESFARMADLLSDNIRRAVTGRPVRNVVNAPAPVVRRR